MCHATIAPTSHRRDCMSETPTQTDPTEATVLAATTEANAPETPTDVAVSPSSSDEALGEMPIETPDRTRRMGWWLDALLFVALVLAALPIRFANTPGDLWGDEADYALA